jgi:hypothetical protein
MLTESEVNQNNRTRQIPHIEIPHNTLDMTQETSSRMWCKWWKTTKALTELLKKLNFYLNLFPFDNPFTKETQSLKFNLFQVHLERIKLFDNKKNISIYTVAISCTYNYTSAPLYT